MPRFYIYHRQKNKKLGILLFKGEPIEAANEESALYRATKKDPGLRRSRLMAVKVPTDIKVVGEVQQTPITVELPASVAPLTPAEMQRALKGETHVR